MKAIIFTSKGTYNFPQTKLMNIDKNLMYSHEKIKNWASNMKKESCKHPHRKTKEKCIQTASDCSALLFEKNTMKQVYTLLRTENVIS